MQIKKSKEKNKEKWKSYLQGKVCRVIISSNQNYME